MYAMKRGMEGRRRDSSSVIAAVLEQCATSTGLTCAFVVVERKLPGRSTLSIQARASQDQRQPTRWRLSPGMRWSLQSAIDSGCPVITTGRRTGSAVYPHVLIAAPILGGGGGRAVLAATGHIPAPYAPAIRSMQRLARMLEAGGLITDPSTTQSGDFMRSSGSRMDVLLHELRTPLSAAGLLLMRLTSQQPAEQSAEQLDDGADDYLREAYRAVQEAQSVVRLFSQLQALNQDHLPITIRSTQIQPIIERAVALLPGAADRLRHVATGGLPDVAADPLWLTHILTNLLENAITHTPAPHTADVTAALSQDGKRVVVSITSYGAGIPLAEQAAVLIPYRRRAMCDDLTSKGLGLSIAKYLVTAMRGDIWVESDGLRSATFCVALPVGGHSAS